ncbi:MAG: N-acetylmuramoyl-L-alanine amidase [Candidatus Margulisbacteria bacterium]|nr:N-acetylmuramoyl-L-alanine amidase [Candidatus Margulisiibacteriota bacterium]
MLKRFLVFGLILNSSLVISHSSFADTAKLESVEMKRDRGFDYLDVYTSGWSEAKGLLLENKLYIDFPGTVIDKHFKVLKKKSKRIYEIRAEQKNKDTARLVVTLKKNIDYDIVNVFGRNKTVVEIGDRRNGETTRQFAWETKNVKKKAAPLKPVKLAPVVSEVKDVSLRHKTIVLDPGHGGDDPGAEGRGSAPEKELTLKTAQACAKLLREAGATVYLSRNEDRRSNLRDVVDFANRAGADIFICIHYNSSDSTKVTGSETYYYNPISRHFAETMHEAIVRGIKEKDRGLHRVGFYTVKYSNMPAVLVEPVYLSNDEEYDLANSSSFRERLAESILKGVKEYFRSRVR